MKLVVYCIPVIFGLSVSYAGISSQPIEAKQSMYCKKMSDHLECLDPLKDGTLQFDIDHDNYNIDDYSDGEYFFDSVVYSGGEFKFRYSNVRYPQSLEEIRQLTAYNYTANYLPAEGPNTRWENGFCESLEQGSKKCPFKAK